MNTANVDCCRKCHDCDDCKEVSVSQLRDTIYAIDYKVSEYSECITGKSLWGIGKCTVTEEDFNKLISYRWALYGFFRSLKRSLNNIYGCLCNHEVFTIIENLSSVLDFSCVRSSNRTDIISDDSGLAEWKVLHPDLIAIDEWEKYAVEIIPKIGFSVKKTDFGQACTILLKIVAKEIEQPEDFIYALSVTRKFYENGCYINREDLGLTRIDYKVKKEEDYCNIDVKMTAVEKFDRCEYEYAVKELKCDITFKNYTRLLECGISHKVISTILECGLDIKYDMKKKDACIVFDRNNKIYVGDVNVDLANADCQVISKVVGKNVCGPDSIKVEKLNCSY